MADKTILWFAAISFIAVVLATGYFFLVEKDNLFYLEASCDSSAQSCFIRDCSEPDSCPPNNLDTYRVFYVAANDFAQCKDNSCLNECVIGKIECEEVICGDSEEDTCSN